MDVLRSYGYREEETSVFKKHRLVKIPDMMQLIRPYTTAVFKNSILNLYVFCLCLHIHLMVHLMPELVLILPILTLCRKCSAHQCGDRDGGSDYNEGGFYIPSFEFSIIVCHLGIIIRQNHIDFSHHNHLLSICV